MDVALWDRVSEAMNKGYATMEERTKIRNALSDTNVVVMSDLPRGIQDLIRELETRPRPRYRPTRR